VTIVLAALLLAGAGVTAVMQAQPSRGSDAPTDQGQANAPADPPPEEVTPEPPEPPVGPDLTADELVLEDKLLDATDCQSTDLPENALASLYCTVDGQPAFYTSFANAGDMRAYFDGEFSGLPDGICGDAWNVQGRWEVEGEVKGRVKCYDVEDGSSSIEWMDNERLIHAIIGSDYGAHEGLFRIWLNSG
jgi:hypothetical protein